MAKKASTANENGGNINQLMASSAMTVGGGNQSSQWPSVMAMRKSINRHESTFKRRRKR
jgi:hypothetical protein